MKRVIQFLLITLLWAGSLSGCTPKEKTPLVVFAAGSLIQPFDQLEKAFEAKYPQIDVLGEYHGSIQVMRHATDLHEKIDVVATADQALIPLLMYGTQDAETGRPYANWYLRFATNELGLAYTEKSKYADEINTENWFEVLTRPDVKVGIADPRFDASGYRAMMVYWLAQNVTGQADLFQRMFDGQFRYPVTTLTQDGLTTIRIPEVLETTADSHIVMRGGSIQLIALLESGDVDYVFEYESVIRQHNLKLVEMPAALSLGDQGSNPFYQGVQVKLDFQRFASVKPEFRGEQIGYGITIPSNAPHPQAAELFLQFLLGPEGQKIMEENHHPLLQPVIADGYDRVPAALQPLVSPAP